MRIARFLLSIALIPLLPITPAQAANQCTIKVCVQVYTDPATGRVVITAKKNPAGRTVKHRAPAPRVSTTPKPKPVWIYKPRIRKPTAVHTKRPGLSLSDRLTQLIPVRPIHVQPDSTALVQVPVNFWTETEPRFIRSVVILGVPVSVNLIPTFTWDFGDGTPPLTSRSAGAPYPSATITHTYHRAGNYEAALHISWAGTWSSEGNTFPVLGDNIVQELSANLRIIEAPTKFTR